MLKERTQKSAVPLVIWYADLSSADVAKVGGKNASLGEMITRLQRAGINVPDGFATTADAYWMFLDEYGLSQLSLAVKVSQTAWFSLIHIKDHAMGRPRLEVEGQPIS
jgi:hypothetical protein